jgi:hypothetical protein
VQTLSSLRSVDQFVMNDDADTHLSPEGFKDKSFVSGIL